MQNFEDRMKSRIWESRSYGSVRGRAVICPAYSNNVGLLSLFKGLYGQVVIPNAVYKELTVKGSGHKHDGLIRSFVDAKILRVKTPHNADFLAGMDTNVMAVDVLQQAIFIRIAVFKNLYF